MDTYYKNKNSKSKIKNAFCCQLGDLENITYHSGADLSHKGWYSNKNEY